MNPIDETIALLERSAAEAYYGEPVTQLEHALQTAQLAQNADADEETILAALLHDIGHVLDSGHLHADLGVIDHDAQGAVWLREHGYSERLVDLVSAHVAAKRSSSPPTPPTLPASHPPASAPSPSKAAP